MRSKRGSEVACAAVPISSKSDGEHEACDVVIY